MRKFKQNKLWRDYQIDLVKKSCGSIIHYRVLDDQEFNLKIKEKLLEEAHEVCDAKNRSELLEELADLYQVIDSIAQLHGISKEEILAAQVKKLEHRGGFMKRIFVDSAEHPTGTKGEAYCDACPEKYPEIL